MMFSRLFICFLRSIPLIWPILFTGCTDTPPPFECSDPLGCVEITQGESMKIGVLQALSGKIAPLGKAQIRGFELALEKRGQKILDHSVVVQIEDTGCTAEGGANSALKIIADPKTLAIFGTTCSGAAATAAHAMSEAGLTMISGNNSAPFLTSIGGQSAPAWRKGYFRTSNNEENAGTIAAQYAYQVLGLRKAATINDSDIYTKGLTSGFKKAFTDLGGEVILDTSVTKGDHDMLPVLVAVSNSGAELLFFPLFQPEGNHILLQAKKLPVFDNIHLFSDGALIEKSFLDAVGESAKGMCFIGPVPPSGPAVEQMNSDYHNRFREAPAVNYYLTAVDAAELLFQGIEQAAIYDAYGNLYIGRKKLRDSLYATKKMQGVTGLLSCDQFGDCGNSAFRILRLDNPEKGLMGLEQNVVYQ